MSIQGNVISGDASLVILPGATEGLRVQRDRVLVVVAHPDDETLGCGATIAKHRRAGDEVTVVALADGVSSRGAKVGAALSRRGMFIRACSVLGTEDTWLHELPDNQMDSVTALEVVRLVETHIEKFRPTVVYTHWRGDMNVDHRITSQAVAVACRPQPGCSVKRLLMFEVPSSTEWGGGFFEPNWFEECEATLETKLDALVCYEEEMRPWPHPRSTQNVRMIAGIRGAMVGVKAAEAFVVGRVICG